MLISLCDTLNASDASIIHHKDTMKRTNIYIPDELLERMKAVAQGRKIAEMVREAIILWLAIEEKKR
jgi:metal-responsive CopG/Arc/MetJ family transcriptional regulator